MCGRFTLTSTPQAVLDHFELNTELEFKPRYNIAPTQDVLVVRQLKEHEREIVALRWGLIPSWLKEDKISSKMINARVETAHERPAYRAAYKKRRCLIVADGFYEWQKKQDAKQPFYIYRKDHRPFAMAGLWEHWESDDGRQIESCTILTKDANKAVESIHVRMPVILQPIQYTDWLNPELQDPLQIKQIIKSIPASQISSHAISTKVNNPTHDKPDCVEPEL